MDQKGIIFRQDLVWG